MATQGPLLARQVCSTTNANPLMFCFVSLVFVLLLLIFVCLFPFETGAHQVSQASLKFTIQPREAFLLVTDSEVTGL